jgi:hypothetical protein
VPALMPIPKQSTHTVPLGTSAGGEKRPTASQGAIFGKLAANLPPQ